MEDKNSDCSLESKLYDIGTQLRWWGVIILVVGVILAIMMTDACAGLVIAILGFIVALHGSGIFTYPGV